MTATTDNKELTVALPRFAFDTGRSDANLLQDINFSAPCGAITVIMGRSGCGKTTLLRILAGLQRVPNLRMQYLGASLHPPHPRIGLVFQDYRLFPWKTVEANIHCAAQAAGRDGDFSNELIGEFGLRDLRSDWPKTLSGGEQARVALARCLVQRPSILLLDEVFRSLDLRTRLDIHETIRRLTRKLSLSTIAVSHDIEEAVQIADHALVLGGTPTTITQVVHRDAGSENALRTRLAELLAERG